MDVERIKMTSHGLAFREIGDGYPVLAIHGWTMTGDAEAVDVEPIFMKRSGYRRIYVDLPGMGKSPIGDVTNLDMMLERLSKYVEESILPSKFILLGSSCGAYLARALAYKYDAAIEGLFLHVPVIEPVSSQRDVDAFVPAVSDDGLMRSIPDDDREVIGQVPVQTRQYVDLITKKVKEVYLPATAASDSASLDRIRNDDNLYRLTAPMHGAQSPFYKPTLILTGRQDTDVGYRDAWKLLPCYPQTTFAALDRSTHAMPVDEHDVFEALVGDWLRRVEQMRQSLETKLESQISSMSLQDAAQPQQTPDAQSSPAAIIRAQAPLQGRYVRMEPLTKKHIPALWLHFEGSGLFQWLPSTPAPTNAEELWALFQSTLQWPDFCTFVIMGDPDFVNPKAGETPNEDRFEPLGTLGCLHINTIYRSVEVGVVVLGEALKRSAAATEAHYLLLKALREPHGCEPFRRICWENDRRNTASRHAAERLGYIYEGTFRNHMYKDGRSRDSNWLSIADVDWPRVKTALEAWLESSNFTKDGNQIRTLKEIRESLIQRSTNA